MTALIKQITGSDCFLACIAMAKGAKHVLDVWSKEDIDKVVASQGVGDPDPWLEQAGFKKGVDYKQHYAHHGTDDAIKALLWKRRAIISVRSLNIDGGTHAVYWDGEALFDPSTLRTYLHLSSLSISQVTLFAPEAAK